MVDSDNDLDSINSLTETLISNELQGFPVNITGGLVEVKAIDEDLDEVSVFVHNESGVAGSYQGVAWRYEVLKYPDGSSARCWRICHSVGGDITSYVDDSGDKIVRTPLTNVTVEGSEVNIASPIGSHDYRQIAMDGVCHRFDELAFDEESDKTTKADIIAKILKDERTSEESVRHTNLTRQRVSYLNETGIFDSTLVMSSIAIHRTEDGVEVLKSESNSVFIAGVKYVALELAIDANGEWVDDARVLSYEVELPGFGHVSVPHILGVTKVYDLWKKSS